MKTPTTLLTGALGLFGVSAAAFLLGRKNSLDRANQLFHAAYGEARAVHEASSPVLLVFEDQLILHRAGERREWPVRPEAFHGLKVAAHAAVALFVLAEGLLERESGGADLVGLARPRLEDALREVQGEVLAGSRALLEKGLELLAHVVERGLERAALDAFAREAGEAVLALTDEATRLNLEALHKAAEEVWTLLTPSELDELEVIVAGDHQARRRSLALQYFHKRLGEAPDEERRVAYAESVANEEEALKLVGTRRLDARIAHAFFGDARRLQRDVLGDAAERRLAAMADFPASPVTAHVKKTQKKRRSASSAPKAEAASPSAKKTKAVAKKKSPSPSKRGGSRGVKADDAARPKKTSRRSKA